MAVPADERPHAPGDHPLWAESWYVDFATVEGLGGFVQLTLWPNQGLAWWWSSFLTPEGLVAVRDHEVPPPRVGLEIRADGLWGELVCETPLEHWSFGLEAFGLQFDDPAEALAGELGQRMAVGLDLEWELTAPPAPGPAPGPPAGVEGQLLQPGTVIGELLFGSGSFGVQATGWRARRWGVCDWWSGPGHTWSPLTGEGEIVGRAPVLVTGPDRRKAALERSLVRVGPAVGWSEALPPH